MNRRHLRVLILVCFVVLLGHGVGAAQPPPCTKQCRVLGQACSAPFQVAFQTQRAACTGEGRRLCIAAARIMLAAGRTLCRSVITTCRQSCRRNGAPAELLCGDGIVAPTEDCDPPGWASCTGGMACGADCSCPAP